MQLYIPKKDAKDKKELVVAEKTAEQSKYITETTTFPQLIAITRSPEPAKDQKLLDEERERAKTPEERNRERSNVDNY